MTKISRNKLSNREVLRLAQYIEQNKASFDHRAAAEIARVASVELGFKVTDANFSNAAADLDITWVSARSTSARRCGSTTKAMQNQIGTTAAVLLQIVKRVGLALSNDEMAILAAAANSANQTAPLFNTLSANSEARND
jgi:hypothetical protein